MSASEHLGTYAEGWTKGDADTILKTVAEGYTFDDPNTGVISKRLRKNKLEFCLLKVWRNRIIPIR